MKHAVLFLSFFYSLLNVNAQSVPSVAAKTTTIAVRWYSYSDYLDRQLAYSRSGGGADYLATYNPVIWNDTTNIIASIAGTTYTQGHSHLLSLGSVFHPQFKGYSDTLLYSLGTVMKVDSTDAYTIDSVRLSYFYYGGSKVTTGHTDTLRLAFNVGDLSVGSSIFYDFITPGGHYPSGRKLPDVTFDSVLVTSAGVPGGVATQYMDILLHATDTSWLKQTRSYEIVDASGAAKPLIIPAANIVSCVFTFKSGNPAAILHVLPGDTLTGVGGRYYNIFQPDVNYISTDNPATVADPVPDWNMYDSTDVNCGLFAANPNHSFSSLRMAAYIPTLTFEDDFPTPPGASHNQYPDIGYHVKCSSCTTVPLGVASVPLNWNINVSPNPANNKVNINFSMAKAADVLVSLTNIVGQVVAMQNISNTASGKATFNTTVLPAGVYVYTLKANGEIATGRVVITH